MKNWIETRSALTDRANEAAKDQKTVDRRVDFASLP